MDDLAGLFSDDCCAVCAKTTNLRKCAKCKNIQYCSKECQKQDWKAAHKALCRLMAQMKSTRIHEEEVETQASSQPAKPESSTSGTASLQNLDTQVEKPFHKLNDGTWLHGRSEKDVFQLLVDSFRLRLDDENGLGGDTEPDSLHARTADRSSAFQNFLSEADNKEKLLPPWWNEVKAKECVTFGMKENQWANLQTVVTKSGIVEYYGSTTMPMQLRILAEDVLGKSLSSAGDAKLMRDFHMVQEAGDGNLGDLDLTQLNLGES